MLTDQSVKCWGSNNLGQIDPESPGYAHIPVTVKGITNASTTITTGTAHTCSLLTDGTIKCWGLNNYGQLGNNTTHDSFVPVAVRGISTATALVTAGMRNCALLANQTVTCWGGGADWDWTLPIIDDTTTLALTPTVVNGITNATALVISYWHACALLADQTVTCWGLNNHGQLGNGTKTNLVHPPVAVNSITNAIALAINGAQTCALLADQTIKCWGINWGGQNGNGTTTDSPAPVLVSNINNAAAIVLGGDHTCALLTDKTIKCWGINYTGQLGDGTTTSSAIPVTVSGITNAVAISPSCALLENGTIKCWGSYFDTTPTLTPTVVDGIHTAIALSGSGNESCAILADNTVKCWGFYPTGVTPTAVPSLTHTAALVMGEDFPYISIACAVLVDQTIKCWGQNDRGQLGSGEIGRSYFATPVQIMGL